MPFSDFVNAVKKGEATFHNNPAISKAVIACNPETMEIIYEFPSTAEAGRNGFNEGGVAAACRGCLHSEGNHKYKKLNWYYK